MDKHFLYGIISHQVTKKSLIQVYPMQIQFDSSWVWSLWFQGCTYEFSTHYAYTSAGWFLVDHQQVISPVISGKSRVNPLIIRATAYLLSGTIHQVPTSRHIQAGFHPTAGKTVRCHAGKLWKQCAMSGFKCGFTYSSMIVQVTDQHD